MKDHLNWKMLLFGMFVYVTVLVALLALCTRASASEGSKSGAEWDAYAKEASQCNAEERVIKLPQDGGKWYISVIGNPNDRQYKSILRRFNLNVHLKALKIQVHFWIVPSNGKAFKERYSHNTKTLPTIRVQQHDGKIVWEASRSDIPLTAEGLYAAIRDSSRETMALLPWRRNGTILPWRDHMEDQCRPRPQPEPNVTPIFLDPLPAPLDDCGPPEFEDTGPPTWAVILSALSAALAGGGYGLFSQWKKLTELE